MGAGRQYGQFEHWAPLSQWSAPPVKRWLIRPREVEWRGDDLEGRRRRTGGRADQSASGRWRYPHCTRGECTPYVAQSRLGRRRLRLSRRPWRPWRPGASGRLVVGRGGRLRRSRGFWLGGRARPTAIDEKHNTLHNEQGQTRDCGYCGKSQGRHPQSTRYRLCRCACSTTQCVSSDRCGRRLSSQFIWSRVIAAAC